MESILFWHWWIVGFGLLIAEVMIAGTFCMWLGIAALITGCAAWVYPPLGWQVEVVLFAALSFISVALWLRFKPLTNHEVDTGLNQRGRQHIGQILTLTSAIVDGFGQARLDDSVWRVAGPDAPAGSKVRVLSMDGTIFKVELLSDKA